MRSETVFSNLVPLPLATIQKQPYACDISRRKAGFPKLQPLHCMRPVHEPSTKPAQKSRYAILFVESQTSLLRQNIQMPVAGAHLGENQLYLLQGSAPTTGFCRALITNMWQLTIYDFKKNNCIHTGDAISERISKRFMYENID
jgi:hypothetical protein